MVMKMKKFKINVRRKTRTEKYQRSAAVKFVSNIRAVILAVLLTTFLSFACESPSLKKPNNTQTEFAVEDKQARFESDLQTMKTANFEYIFVFRRKDGGAFDGEDRRYLKTNSPPETNRFIATDDDKAFIAGSKYKFPPENLEVLRMWFNVEDYSAIQEQK